MRFLKVARFSSVGVFFAGIIGVIQGCSVEREGALFAVLLFLLNFCSGPITEETTTGGAAPATLPIILYDSGRTGNGAIGNRDASTLICKGPPATPPAGYTRFIALLSYTGDAVIDFPTTHTDFDGTLPVIGFPSGLPIVDKWVDLFGILPQSTNLLAHDMHTALGIPTTPNHWTGSTAFGATQPSFNCNGWTASVTGSGATGSPKDRDFNWINAGIISCTGPRQLICVAY